MRGSYGTCGTEKRLRIDQFTGPVAGGIFEESRFFVGLSAEWRLSPAFSILGVLGAQISGKFELDDDDGDRIKKTDLGTAPMAGLGFELRF